MSISRSLLLRASRSAWIAAQFRRRAFARRAVRRFMPGEDAGAALAAAEGFESWGAGSVLTHLGEQVREPTEALAVRDHYLALLDDIAARGLDTHVSVKPTHLGLDLDPELCAESIRALAERAEASGSMVWIDMEESWYVDATLALFRAARERSARVGLCLQAYLRRTAADLDALLPLAPAIRLVKGAYREPPEVAYPRKRDTDAAFEALGRRLLDAAPGGALPVFGTHDAALVERLRRAAEERRVPPGAFEVHMLYGIQEARQRALAADGVTVRVLVSYGENWYPWYVRRLAERPANLWFVVRTLFG